MSTPAATLHLPMRVLMISKACVVGAYQTKLEQIAHADDIELLAVVPPAWRERSHTLVLERAHTAGYRLAVEPIAFNGSFHLHFYPRLARRVREFAPDIVHIDEEPYNLATAHALLLARRCGARALWFSWQNLLRHYPLPFRLIERYSLSRADYALVGSAGAAAVWRRKGYSGPLAIIPQFGVDTALYAPHPKTPDPTGFIIGYAGRLVPEKGVDLLLEACAGLQAPVRLRIAGEGPQRPRLEALAHRLGLAEKVMFQGRVPSLHMPEFYRSLDVLVLPSRSRSNWVEQFGRALVEAMACGVAVVGSDCGEIPTVVADAGLIFPEGDVEALRACLEHLARDPSARAVLAERGRARVSAHYTQEQVAARTVAVYRQMFAAAP